MRFSGITARLPVTPRSPAEDEELGPATPLKSGVVTSCQRGERRADGPPDESPGDRAGERAHSVTSLVERAADLAEPIDPRLRGRHHAGMVPASPAPRAR
ncbi:hypothetical protein TNCT1_12040 [Streptomyces sp. 1-11]|nr:hypothetical protein TNCT1_12040 [Streptomyces sp. 1-11]